MTNDALRALPPLTEAVLRLARFMDDVGWATPSACPGWSVHDVLIHLACTFREMVDPESMPAPGADGIERANDRAVVAFRGRTARQTLDDYHAMAGPLGDVVASQQVEPEASVALDFGDVGTYAQHFMADSLVFDHYCHLRHDLGGPGREALAALTSDEHATVLHSSTRWLIAGLPQMSPSRLADVLASPVELELTGPGGGLWTLIGDGDGTTLVDGSAAHAEARITSSTEDLVRWGTHRASWYDAGVTLDGDVPLAERVVSAIKVI